MSEPPPSDGLTRSLSDHVLTVVLRRPPDNFFDRDLVEDIATAFEEADADPDIRAIVLAADGKVFCAGADFAGGGSRTERLQPAPRHLYREAIRLFRTKKPVVAAVQGAAIGGGLGLACAADFRVTCQEGRFSANFTRIGLHPGFGLTVTLPRLVGHQAATLLFYTGRRVKGEEAVRMGLADMLVPLAEVRSAAQAVAREIAISAPLGVLSTRETMRRGLADAVEAAMERELMEQNWLRTTDDFKVGLDAMAQRRLPSFSGR